MLATEDERTQEASVREMFTVQVWFLSISKIKDQEKEQLK
jgi:hypothetical protein